MNKFISCSIIAAAAIALIGCGGMQQTRDDTKAVGLLVKSIGSNAEVYQKQRDAIAMTSLRNRQSLERLAMQYEAGTSGDIAAWEIAGQSERKRLFDTVRTAADKLQALREQQQAREQEQAQELAKARSAVNFRNAKIVESAAGLVKLGEERSSMEEAKFFLKFAQDVRTDIAKDSEAAAADASKEAQSSLSSKGDK